MRHITLHYDPIQAREEILVRSYLYSKIQVNVKIGNYDCEKFRLSAVSQARQNRYKQAFVQTKQRFLRRGRSNRTRPSAAARQSCPLSWARLDPGRPRPVSHFAWFSGSKKHIYMRLYKRVRPFVCLSDCLRIS